MNSACLTSGHFVALADITSLFDFSAHIFEFVSDHFLYERPFDVFEWLIGS